MGRAVAWVGRSSPKPSSGSERVSSVPATRAVLVAVVTSMVVLLGSRVSLQLEILALRHRHGFSGRTTPRWKTVHRNMGARGGIRYAYRLLWRVFVQLHWKGSVVRFPIRIRESRAGLAALLRALLVTGFVLGVASAAQARTETLRFSYRAPPEVSGFRVYIGSASRIYTRSIDIGLPAVDGDGNLSYDLQVADDETVYIAISAYNAAGEGPLSNERMRAPGSSPANQPASSADEDVPERPGKPMVISPVP